AGTSVGPRALAAHRQPAAMPHSSVAANISQPRDVLRYLAAELTLNGVVTVEQHGNPGHLGLGDISGRSVRIDSGLAADLPRGIRPDSIQIGQRHPGGAIVGDVNTKKTRH